MAPPSFLENCEDGSERYNIPKFYALNNVVYIINFFFLTFNHSFFVWKNSFTGEDYADVNWEGLGFSLVPTDYMYMMKCAKGEKFSQGTLIPYGNLELSPAAGILNYGQVKIPQYLVLFHP